MPTVELRDIVTEEDMAAVLQLRRGPGQERYLGRMESHFEDAITDAEAMPRYWSTHDAETGQLVGFVMISDNIPEPIPEDMIGPYFLWRLLVDERFQRLGYGAATIDAVVRYLATRPDAVVLYTSCKDGPGSPKGFYLRHGFTETGREMWGEELFALDLAG